MKEVEYLGVTYEVENRVKFISTDLNGEIWAFEDKPDVSDPYLDMWDDTSGEIFILKSHGEDCLDWKETLREV